ncbi:AMP-binding protein [Flavobacteriaceae bacterium TP-CH-4]|uniref:AMP-binding protein n=1 Tax=Pelagihabitans pacificus TaxID=2696054 RepID=A0A967ASM8_9FLAO|nr:AMP-binding protein [Pelagihabitans pacificus]NHF59227.1 AMP-binding protein [Pelagihabitans pacificus]
MTTEPDFREIHPDFKFNGISFNREELKEVAYSLIKEGEPFELVIGDFLTDWINDKETIEVKTSGTTGKAKTIVLEKQKMVGSALATGKYFGLEPKDTALLCLPTDYIAGKMMLVRAMALGLEIDCVAPSADPLSLGNKTYDFAAMVPLQLQNSLNQINRIKTLIVGGAPIAASLKQALQGRKTAVFETYGMTETISHIAVRPINRSASKTSYEGEAPFETLPDITVTIDERGCLVINAPKISKESVVTNDMVNLLSDTTFEWLGRFDHIINSGGVKLNPEQIEAKLTPLIENRFFVAGLPDDRLGEKLVLVLEGEADASELSKKINALTSLEKFERPKHIFKIDKLKETGNGKIDRKASIESLNQK